MIHIVPGTVKQSGYFSNKRRVFDTVPVTSRRKQTPVAIASPRSSRPSQSIEVPAPCTAAAKTIVSGSTRGILKTWATAAARIIKLPCPWISVHSPRPTPWAPPHQAPPTATGATGVGTLIPDYRKMRGQKSEIPPLRFKACARDLTAYPATIVLRSALY